MKLRVIGWACYDDDLPEGENCWAARNAVIDDIKKHGYLFSGWTHQEGYCCAPVLNDGKIYCFSQRGWGDVMAEAHDHTDRMDYVKFAFAKSVDFNTEICPKEYFDEDTFVPECDLNERFELEVSQKVFASAQHSHEIKLDDLPELRYLDINDTLALTYGEKTAEFTVVDVNRKRDLTEERLRELRFAFFDFHDMEKKKLAEKEFNNAKIVIIIKLA